MRDHFRSNGSLEEMFLELTSENSPFAQGADEKDGTGEKDGAAEKDDAAATEAR